MRSAFAFATRGIVILLMLPVTMVWGLSLLDTSESFAIDRSSACDLEVQPLQTLLRGFCAWHATGASPEACIDGRSISSMEIKVSVLGIADPYWQGATKGGCLTQESFMLLIDSMQTEQ